MKDLESVGGESMSMYKRKKKKDKTRLGFVLGGCEKCESKDLRLCTCPDLKQRIDTLFQKGFYLDPVVESQVRAQAKKNLIENGEKEQNVEDPYLMPGNSLLLGFNTEKGRNDFARALFEGDDTIKCVMEKMKEVIDGEGKIQKVIHPFPLIAVFSSVESFDDFKKIWDEMDEQNNANN